ncbi:unnamed protein product [Calypogeia fissa]
MQSCRRASALIRPILQHQSRCMTVAMPALIAGFNKPFSVHPYHSGSHDRNSPSYMGTTVLCVRKDGKVIVIGDGQVTLGSQIIKPNVKKVRKIGDSVIGGFAGATADSFTLFERLESKLEEHPGQVPHRNKSISISLSWQ